ncbi:hypothetical protein F0562_011024 [Nyssa sinensis]|uniref:Uncharacterized protein n=1 Tax=Nyssa sinensis TaxID=561372 RepID=A0A5J5A5A8_9ASTE|nr:hypothetical protein F0562_011024 [Nyssa sinensis]
MVGHLGRAGPNPTDPVAIGSYVELEPYFVLRQNNLPSLENKKEKTKKREERLFRGLKMEIVIAAVKKIAEPIAESMGLQIGYLVHYDENIELLEEENEKLDGEKRRVQVRVDEAETNGEIIEDDVWSWLTKVTGMKEEVDKFLVDLQVQEQRRCFILCSRYRVSKEAKEKTDAVIKLKDDGKFERIAHPAPPPEFGFQSSAYYETFESRVSIFNEIMEALKDNSVKLFGIYGIGGAGKTRMVEEVGKQVKKDGVFHEVVMAVVSQNVNVREIQGKLADRLNLQLKGESEDGRAGELWNRLNNGKQNLVILDDVWEELNLKAIGIPVTDGIKGCCKVVLTSRNQGVFQKMKVQNNFQLRVLSQKESWNLFKKMVGNSIDSPEINYYAEEVCKECGGLPVAILAVAAALKDKDEHAWADALKQLRDSMLKNIEGVESTVYSSLELSYNHLPFQDAKWCFLLCCLFREDAEISIDDLVRYGMGLRVIQNADTLEEARNRVHTLVGTLKTRCLLLEGSRAKNIVKMHDVIRDVAISIANDKEAFLVKRGVNLQEWPDKAVYQRCRVISLSCGGTKYLCSPFIARGLVQLQVLKVIDCNDMEEIIGNDQREGKEEQVVFQQLKIMELSSLPKLRSFYPKSLKSSSTKEGNPSSSIPAQALFNEKVAFPSLEIFIILRLGSIIEIWDNQSESFSQLRTLSVCCCYNLRNVSSLSIVKNLVLLREVTISDCPKMEEILATGETTKKNGQEGESDNAIITFPQLKTLYLGLLPNLKSFCSSRFKKEDEEIVKDKDILQAQPFFNHKVAFPSLESFTIVRLDSTIEIWDNQSESFSQLRTLNVRYCVNLRNVFSLSNVKNLMLLQEVEIFGCPKIEEILATGETTKKHGQEGESNNAIITFPQLKTLKLVELPNLKSFCSSRFKKEDEEIVKDKNILQAQPLFNHKVAFPSLENFTIWGLYSIVEIWDNQSESFSQLRTLNVHYCHKLRNVFSLSNVKNLMFLQEVEIIGRPKMEEILATGETTKKHGQEGESNNAIITFPQLKTLKLVELPNLKSFCSSRFKKEDEEIVKDKDILPAQPFFNHKVGFPVLEELHLTHCDNVTIVFSANSLQRLQNLGKFGVENCNQMRVVFDLEGLNVGKQQVEVQLPLRELQLTKLPTLNCIWNKDPKGIVSFRSLNKVIIQKCGLLKSLCTSSVARTLEQLQLLVIISCTLMEEIVAKEESGEVTDEIIFPQLKFLILVNLRNLTCFCRANYAFNMPSLRRAELVNCPKMQTSGQLSMSNIEIYADENQWVRKKKLDRFIKRRGALTLTDGNNDDISSADSDRRDNEYDSNITRVWSGGDDDDEDDDDDDDDDDEDDDDNDDDDDEKEEEED